MKSTRLALAALLAMSVASPAAQAKEVLCREVPLVKEPVQAELQREFTRIGSLANGWTTAAPIPESCRKPLASTGALYDATFRYRVVFVTERLPLCDAATGVPTRMVDAVNDPDSGMIRVWDQAWESAQGYEQELITTHELAGIAGEINEPWTTSICWMFVPLLPGVHTSESTELPNVKRPNLILLAEGGGGGSTGGHGGGDVRMAGFKFRALILLLDKVSVLSACGMTDRELEHTIGQWLSLEIRDPEAWKATDAQILVQSIELGKDRKATDLEKSCVAGQLQK